MNGTVECLGCVGMNQCELGVDVNDQAFSFISLFLHHKRDIYGLNPSLIHPSTP